MIKESNNKLALYYLPFIGEILGNEIYLTNESKIHAINKIEEMIQRSYEYDRLTVAERDMICQLMQTYANIGNISDSTSLNPLIATTKEFVQWTDGNGWLTKKGESELVAAIQENQTVQAELAAQTNERSICLNLRESLLTIAKTIFSKENNPWSEEQHTMTKKSWDEFFNLGIMQSLINNLYERLCKNGQDLPFEQLKELCAFMWQYKGTWDFSGQREQTIEDLEKLHKIVPFSQFPPIAPYASNYNEFIDEAYTAIKDSKLTPRYQEVMEKYLLALDAFCHIDGEWVSELDLWGQYFVDYNRWDWPIPPFSWITYDPNEPLPF